MALPAGTPTVTINGIQCFELVAQYREGFELGQGQSGNKAYLCNWSDRFTVAQGLLGLSSTVSVGGVITLNTPLAHPQMANCYAHSIDITGMGPPIQGSGNIAFATAVVAVNYTNLPWTFSGFDYMQLNPATPYVYAKQNMDMSIQYVSVPGRMLKFSGSGKPIGQAFAFPVPIIQMSITLIRVPYLPSQQALLAATNGPLNSASFLGCAARFVMFNGMRNEQTRATDGTFTQDITYSFSYRPVAQWDRAYDASVPGWAQVVDTSGNPMMGATDLNGLIPSIY